MAVNIKYSKSYDDGSGEKVSLEINTQTDKDFQVIINENSYNDGVSMSIDDLVWLREHIDKALSFIREDAEK